MNEPRCLVCGDVGEVEVRRVDDLAWVTVDCVWCVPGVQIIPILGGTL